MGSREVSTDFCHVLGCPCVEGGMESSPIAQNGVRRRLIAVFAAAVALATSLVATHLTAPPAQANGGSTPITITSELSSNAPGMVKVSWTEPSGVSSLWNQSWHYRISWVTTSGGAPIGTVVLDQQSMPRTATTSVIIPHLEAATNYTVSVDVVTASASAYHPVAGIALASSDVSVSAGPLPTCSGTLICGEWSTSSATVSTPQIRTSVYSYQTSGDMMRSDNDVSWNVHPQWPTHNSRTQRDWIPATFLFDDRSGQLAPQWWNPFASDDGTTFERSTHLLVRAGGRSVNFGTVTLSAGVAVTGVLSSQVVDAEGLPVLLNGAEQTRPLVASDFKDLCVEVLRDMGDGQSVEFTSVNCAGPSGFGVDPNDPGAWRMSLREGNYRLRFIDRANYFGVSNVLLYNVTFSAQFWRPDGQRGERLFPDPTNSSILASGVLEVTSSARTNIDGVLRPARQLRVDIVDIPFTVTMSASPTLNGLTGAVYAQDTVSGAWTGGAMTLVTTSASPPNVTSATLSANVTGLVAGRVYRIFLMAGNWPPFEGSLSEQWVVGGGTFENASGLVPGEVIVEPWPVKPLLATLHRPDGSAYGADQACLAVFPVGGSISGTPAASACTDQLGQVSLQRLPLGNYQVYAYKKNGNSVVGTPVLISASFAVTRSLPSGPDGRIVGLSDVSRLSSGASLPNGYFPIAAVVLP